MKIKVRVLDFQRLLALNGASIRAGRKQSLQPEQMPGDHHRLYAVNYYEHHEFARQRDIRMSVVLKPGVRSAWLDVSPEEFAAIPEIELTELEWEAIHCTGTPASTE